MPPPARTPPDQTPPDHAPDQPPPDHPPPDGTSLDRAQPDETSPDHHSAFGGDRFGVLAERFARFFGTPRFIIGQTAIVALWIALNALALTHTIAWDRYPFIALNLLFSLQAAYAAPLILLAQTRQADRDKRRDKAFQAHREAEAKRVAEYEAQQARTLVQDKQLAEQHTRMLEQNTELTRQVATLTEELHKVICANGPDPVSA